MDELLLDFVTESKEHLETIEDDFVILVQNQDDPDPELVNKVFRAIHTVKGVAGFVGQKNIGTLSHIMESLLQQIKLEEKKPEQRFVDALLKGVDQLNEMLDHIDESNDMDISTIYEEIKVLVEEDETKVVVPTEDPSSKPISEPSPAQELPEETAPMESAPEEPPPDIPEISLTPEMISRFSQESLDLLDDAEQSLLNVAKTPDDSIELINEAFRMMHSFKGNCGFFGLADFEKLSHKVENVLDAMRTGKAKHSKDNIGLLLSMIDFLRNGLNDYATNDKRKILGLQGMLDLLNDLSDTSPKQTTPPETAQPGKTPQPTAPPPPKKTEPVKVKAEPSTSAKPEKARITPKKEEKTSAKTITAPRQGIRVDIEKLDKLINLVGELVIAESMVVRNPALDNIEDENLERAIHHLDRVSTDLQDVAMSVRMVPLSGTFRKMTRLVYDVSKKAGKKVELQLAGEDTEVDKTVIEKIGDPLVHIVRNSVDHGIGTPEDRIAGGKPETGIVHIEAKHEGGEVWIVIKDDGRGLNREKILQKAVDKDLLTEEEASSMADEDVYKLIFEPGFSTADQVTDISGRGVGMDVVKKNIEKLKGRVEVSSTPGEGSVFTLHIPLTLAIIEGMLTRVGDVRYTIPLLSIRETLQPTADMITGTARNR